MSINNEDYTTYEMSGNNPTEDIAGSYLMLMEIIKLLNVMHDENNIITDMQITLRTKKDFEHTHANSIGCMGVNIASTKTKEEITNDLNELMNRWYGVTTDTLNPFQYKNFLGEFAAICKNDIHKVLVGAGINDNFNYVTEINEILEEYNIPFCIMASSRLGYFNIVRNTWAKEEK